MERSFAAGLTREEDGHEISETRTFQNAKHTPETEKSRIFSLISRSGWLFLVTKLCLSLVAKKVDFESSNETHVARLGLLPKDSIRNFYINYCINLTVGIPLGMLADCFLGKKVIMVSVLCLTISFYFYMVVAGLRPVWVDQPQLFNWKTEVFIQTTLHSIRGIETAAMLESIKSENHKLLYGYTFLKIFLEQIGRTIFIIVYFLCSPNEDYLMIVHFICLFVSTAVFFIWTLYVSSLKQSAVPNVSLSMLQNTISALMWKLRLSNKNEHFVNPIEFNKQIKILKRILLLSLLIIPSITTGFLYLASAFILREPLSRLKPLKPMLSHLIQDIGHRALILAILPLVEFLIVPSLRQTLNIKITIAVRLATSMIIGYVAYLYGLLVVRMMIGKGSPLPDNWSSQVRFVNALNYSVVIRPIDKSFANTTVLEKSEVLLTYVQAETKGANTGLLEVQLESTFEYVASISLEGEQCVTYFISDFMELQRVPGADPIFEGPPGTNYPSKARLYFANFEPEVTVELVLTFQHSSFNDLRIDEPYSIQVKGGQKKVFQVEAGTYILAIPQADVLKSCAFGPGGVYGVIYRPEIKEGTLNYVITEILPPKSLSYYYGFLYVIIAKISVSFVIVVMEVFVFMKTPVNWRSSAFSCYHFFSEGFLPLCHYIFHLTINESGLVGMWTIIIYMALYTTMCLLTGFILIKCKAYFVL